MEKTMYCGVCCDDRQFRFKSESAISKIFVCTGCQNHVPEFNIQLKGHTKEARAEQPKYIPPQKKRRA